MFVIRLKSTVETLAFDTLFGVYSVFWSEPTFGYSTCWGNVKPIFLVAVCYFTESQKWRPV